MSDGITVLRDGKNAGSLKIDEFDRDVVIKMMVGRIVGQMFNCRHKPKEEIILSLNNFKISERTTPFDLKVKKGEIVGLAGLVGSGRTEMAKSVYGARQYPQGQIIYMGKTIKKPEPSSMVRKGLVYLSEDRKTEGLITDMNICENITMSSLYKQFPKKFINRKKETSITEKYVNDLKIISHSIYQLVNTLSGGNQQRVVFAKWLAVEPKLLILDEPTRGIDVNAKD